MRHSGFLAIAAAALLATPATATPICYADLGNGIIDLSALCGRSAGSGGSPVTSQPSVPSAAPSITTESAPVPFAPYGLIGGVEACADARTERVIDDPNVEYQFGDLERFYQECADTSSVVRFVDGFSTPQGAVQIVRGDGDLYVRVPWEDMARGWGPFPDNDAAQAFAAATQAEYR